MAVDIYEGQKDLGGVFNGTTAAISVGTTTDSQAGALVQNLNVRYDRQITRILELGSETQYYVVGQSQGNGQFEAILGPNNIVLNIINTLADACNAPQNVVRFSADSQFCGGARGGSTLQLTMSHAVLTSISVGVAVQDFLVRQGGAFLFIALKLDSRGN